MSAKPSAHRVATAFAVGAIGLGLLTACSDDSEGGSPVAQSTTAEATSSTADECGGQVPTGPLAVPASSVEYTAGEAAYSVTLSDGTTQCVEVDVDSGAGDYDSTDKEIGIRFGDASAGLLITIDSETDGNLPTDVPHQVEDAFMGLQVDGGYFADSMHTACEATLTGFDDEAISGTFLCTGVALLGDGPFGPDSPRTVAPQPLDTSVEKAQGWFSVRV